MINESYLLNLKHILQIGVIKASGMKILALDDGYTKIVLPFNVNANHVNTLYAGSMTMLGGVVGGIYWGMMFDVEKFFPIVKSYSIKYLRPAKADIFIEYKFEKEEASKIQEEAKIKGKCDYQLELPLKTEDGAEVAIFNGIWQLRSSSHTSF